MKISQECINSTIELCQKLIQSPSNSGCEAGVVEALQTYMQANDFDDIRIDKYGSIIGCIKGKYPGPKILFDGHIDTVPVPNPEAWTQDPYGGARVDGKIYGRGTTDMKGALAAATVASVFYAKEVNREFAGEIYIAGVVHEECFEGIAAREISKIVNPDLVIICEASELNLKIGQRGRGELVVETFGIPAHSANPHKGVNAVHLMCLLVQELDKMVPPEDPTLGKGVAVLTDIISTPYPGASVVPSHCRATYDRRLLVGETKESVIKPFEATIDRLTSTIPNFKAKVSYAFGQEQCHTGIEISGDRFFPGWCATPEEAFVQKAMKGLQMAGVNAEISHYSFCTNGSHYAGEANINTIGFGPSTEVLAHVIDEYVEEAQLIKAIEGYVGICQAFLNK